MENEGFYKVIVIGDYNTGKSAILNRLLYDRFDSSYSVTVSVEYSTKSFEIDGESILLQIWDSAGQDKFRSLVRVFFVGVVAVFLTYSIDNRNSFDNLDKWLGDAREKANEGAIIVLVGNKSDLNREVQYDEGLNYMKNNNLDFFFETSAMSGDNILIVFEDAARKILEKERLNKRVSPRRDTVRKTRIRKLTNTQLPALNYDSEEKKKKGGCC